MKGLLLKDWYMLKSIGRTYLMILAIFLALSVADQSNAFMTYYPCLMSVMLVVSLIAYDEREKWNVYAQALPYTKAQLVSCKYILSLCMGGGCALAITAVQLIAGHGALIAEVISMLIPFALLPPAVLLPFIFKYGVEKGRILYYVVIAVACAAFVALGDVSFNPLWLIALSIALYALSWLLSIRFFQQREM